MITPRGGGRDVELAFEDIRVLAIDNAIREEGNPRALPGGSVTFEVRPEDVREFLSLRETHKITLVLKSIFDAELPKDDRPRGEIVVLRYGQG